MTSKIKLKKFNRFILLFAVGLLFMRSVSSAALVPLLSFSENTVIAGQTTEFDVYFHNESQETLTTMIPHQLQFLVSLENGTVQLLSAFGLSAAEMSTTLAPGNYHKKSYIVRIPADLRGIIRYKLGGFPQSAGLLMVGQAQTKPATSETSVMKTESLEQSPTLNGLESLYQTYSANLSAYQPTYFLLGADPEQSKFQISFKYRLFNPSGSLSRKFSWFDGFYLGYTQTSHWDLDSDSAPFEDTSYKPELFYVTGNIPFRPAWLDGFVIQTGMQHESNGRDGDSSRSTNYVYIKPKFIYYHQASQIGMMLSPRFLAYFNNNNGTNPDFADYRGHVGLEASLGKAHSFVIKTNLRFAEEGISVQTDLTYPIHRLLWDNLDLYFHIQYSNALAESLINYRERVDAVRFGISLVR